MQRGIGLALTAVLALLLLTGMGELGGAPNGAIPETAVDIAAVITDRQGVKTAVNNFSMGGKTYLEGARGSARITVDFRQMVSLEFSEAKVGDEMPVRLTLREGDPLQLQVKKAAVFFGSTGYGTYQIRAHDIQRIEFPR
ncbi:MAG: hypothetical protein IH614_14875 [Desulfuromonadales bacterium]|nr:hypothetical protein [Desulfuromonadales bacterium]